MSNLFASLQTAGDSMRVFERSIDTTQNNVSNASTPGYVKQRLALEALPFQLNNSLPGGVSDAGLIDTRSQFAEGEVRKQNESLGNYSQQATDLAGVSALFDVTGASGIPSALNSFFQSLSAWGVDPNSTTARQDVLDKANQVAASFRQTADGLATEAGNIDSELAGVTTQINTIGANLAELNKQRQENSTADPGLDAQIYSNLEQLSELTNFTVLHPADGTVTVLLGGQSPLVLGSNHFDIQASIQQPATPAPVNPGGPPSALVLDSDGKNITGLFSGGRIGGLLSVRNGVLATLRGDSQQVGDLNVFAKQFADRVNQILTNGRISDGPPPVPGVPLFTYSAADPTVAARTLNLTNITPAQLATIQPGPPAVSNGVILQLAGLGNSTNAADHVNGATYTQFYGSLAARVGQQLSQAKDKSTQQTQAVAQARSLRQQVSGVSLDEEATHLLELQRSYQAAAQMITIINSLADAVLNMLN